MVLRKSRRIPVRSSVLRWIEFESKTSTLVVGFVTGEIYRYQKVPRARFAALLKAPSKGRYFNACIRDRYSFVHAPGVWARAC